MGTHLRPQRCTRLYLPYSWSALPTLVVAFSGMAYFVLAVCDSDRLRLAWEPEARWLGSNHALGFTPARAGCRKIEKFGAGSWRGHKGLGRTQGADNLVLVFLTDFLRVNAGLCRMHTAQPAARAQPMHSDAGSMRAACMAPIADGAVGTAVPESAPQWKMWEGSAGERAGRQAAAAAAATAAVAANNAPQMWEMSMSSSSTSPLSSSGHTRPAGRRERKRL